MNLESSSIRSEVTQAEAPIFSLAWECNGLIQECAGKTKSLPSIEGLLGDYERRFSAWLDYLYVFAENHVNLDCRLDCQPELQDIIIRLLLVLRRNLTQRKNLTISRPNQFI
jgi:hypothetical protein